MELRDAPPSTVEIRPARRDDYDAIAELTVAAYSAPPRPGEGPAPGLRGHVRTEYVHTLRDVARRAADALVLVALDGGRVAGAVTYVPGPGPYAEFDEPDAAGIRMLAVDPAVQGRGIGRALVEECIARARAAGKTLVVLHTTTWMHAARRLYERLGFVRAPERDRWPAPDVLLLAFELDLVR
ncbi:MAG TPA: GNAT family N-acetyltransferase [Actinomycetota bacterium]|nr:GNAT family N-acetyltransferase [Actinomycetota bacterium]